MRSVRAFSLLFLALLPAAAAGTAQDKLPGANFYPGWEIAEPDQHFPGSALFDHIDGGAEIFLEFGFRELVIRKYAKGGDELGLEIYEMDTPESALGIYLMKAGRETPVPNLDARNTGETAQIMMLRGRFLIYINNFRGGEACLPVMKELARAVLKWIPEQAAVDIRERLPGNGLLPDSGVLFRGPVGLQAVYYLGEGDILSQNREIFGAAGTYSGRDGSRFTIILIDYPEGNRAAEAFRSLRGRLDSYLPVLFEDGRSFIFRDFKKEYGSAVLEGRRILLKVNLSSKPEPGSLFNPLCADPRT